MRNIQRRLIANVLGYHSKYFQAQSYWQLGSNAYTTAGTSGKGMNYAIAYLTVCVEKFNEAKPFVDSLGGAYASNFQTKYQDAQ